MPVLARFSGFEIRMFFEDHNPPHVHVVGPEFEMLVAIRDRRVLAGKAPARAHRTAMTRILKNRAALLAKWEEYQ